MHILTLFVLGLVLLVVTGVCIANYVYVRSRNDELAKNYTKYQYLAYGVVAVILISISYLVCSKWNCPQWVIWLTICMFLLLLALSTLASLSAHHYEMKQFDSAERYALIQLILVSSVTFLVTLAWIIMFFRKYGRKTLQTNNSIESQPLIEKAPNVVFSPVQNPVPRPVAGQYRQYTDILKSNQEMYGDLELNPIEKTNYGNMPQEPRNKVNIEYGAIPAMKNKQD